MSEVTPLITPGYDNSSLNELAQPTRNHDPLLTLSPMSRLNSSTTHRGSISSNNDGVPRPAESTGDMHSSQPLSNSERTSSSMMSSGSSVGITQIPNNSYSDPRVIQHHVSTMPTSSVQLQQHSQTAVATIQRGSSRALSHSDRSNSIHGTTGSRPPSESNHTMTPPHNLMGNSVGNTRTTRETNSNLGVTGIQRGASTRPTSGSQPQQLHSAVATTHRATTYIREKELCN
ncbi:hypothetical protein F5880DRAFT_1729601, partial [Lentinula raphanica]